MSTQSYAAVDDSDNFENLIQGLHDLNTTRYISAVGIVLLLYDHFLTLADSIDFVKNSPPSLEKTAFLLNRYLVPLSQICAAVFMDHFSGSDLPDLSCQVVVSLTFVVGILSIASSNVLVMLRVIHLWNRDHFIIKFLAYGFVISFLATVGFAIEVMYRSLSGIKYVSYAHSCVSTIKASTLPGVWASSLIFEVMVLALVIYNGLSRPRGNSTPLTRVLCRDGILFFVALAGAFISPIVSNDNLINGFTHIIIHQFYRLAPTLVFCGVYFNWALTTLVLNRSLLNIYKATSEAGHTRLSSRYSKKGSNQDLDENVEEYPLSDLMESVRDRRYSDRRR
ncbi:hypothetical protein ACEPAI_7548 [Sanghuangporus weigelae]